MKTEGLPQDFSEYYQLWGKQLEKIYTPALRVKIQSFVTMLTPIMFKMSLKQIKYTPVQKKANTYRRVVYAIK